MDISIVDETLGEFVSFSERDTLPDTQHGVLDGQRDYPPSHQTGFSPHELGRISEARAALNKYTRRLREAFDQIDEQITARRVERDTEYVSRKDSLVEQKNSNLSVLKQTIGPGSTVWRDATTQCNEAVREYQEQEFRAGRPPRVSFATPIFGNHFPALGWMTTYVLILTVLAVLEMPINEVGVRVAFEFPAPMSYVVALFIGVTFVMFAHFLGIQVNRAMYRHSKRRFLSILGALLVTILALAMIFVLYKMRGQVTELANTGLTAGQLLSGENVVAAARAAANSPTWWGAIINGVLELLPWTGGGADAGSPKYAQFGLLLLNIMVFATGTLFSVGRHDPDVDLERSWTTRKSAERSMSNLQSRYEKSQAQVEEEFSNKIVVTQRRADTILAEMAKLEAEKERLLRQATNDMRLVLDALTQQITAYQKGNQQARQSRTPAYFGHAGLLTLGDNLAIR